MIELRWLDNGQEKILQYRTRPDYSWEDVPTHIEQKPEPREYVLQSGEEYLSSIQKGMGKAKHISLSGVKDHALKFETELEARIYLEENQLSIFDYKIVRA